MKAGPSTFEQLLQEALREALRQEQEAKELEKQFSERRKLLINCALAAGIGTFARWIYDSLIATPPKQKK